MKPVRFIVLSLTFLFAASILPAWQGSGSATTKAPANSSAKASANSKTAANSSAKTAKSATASAPAGTIDINHASKDDLKQLPGIGDAYANAIIKNRPYKNKTQLKSRNVIPDATYNKIKDNIIAKQ